MKNKQTFISLLFLCFLSFNTAFAANLGPKIVVTNWSNPMDNNGCIIIADNGDYILSVDVTVIVGKDDLSPFPSLYYSYDFGGLEVGRSNRISNTDLVMVNDNGNIVFQATFNHKIDYTELCQASSTPGILNYSINLETPAQNQEGTEPPGENFTDYPVADYKGTLFPEYLFFDEYGNPIAPTSLITGQKDICCNYTEAQSNRLAAPSITASPNLLTPDFQISPNPFQEEFLITFDRTPETALQVELFNVSGKRVVYHQILGDQISNTLRIDTQELATGFYYCRVNNGKSYKIIKLGN